MQFPDPFGIFGVFTAIAIVMVIIPIIIFVVVIVFISKACRGTGSTMTIQPPAFVIPEAQRSSSSGGDIRTVRVPTKCPSCGAALTPETIDWVGPLEAKCTYCGSVVQAKFEKV